jgi:hypothetical protein
MSEAATRIPTSEKPSFENSVQDPNIRRMDSGAKQRNPSGNITGADAAE